MFDEEKVTVKMTGTEKLAIMKYKDKMKKERNKKPMSTSSVVLILAGIFMFVMMIIIVTIIENKPKETQITTDEKLDKAIATMDKISTRNWLLANIQANPVFQIAILGIVAAWIINGVGFTIIKR